MAFILTTKHLYSQMEEDTSLKMIWDVVRIFAFQTKKILYFVIIMKSEGVGILEENRY